MLGALCAILLSVPTFAEDAAPADAAPAADAEPAAPGDEAASTEEDDENDPTKKVLKQLTIVMAGEAIDANSFEVRETAKAGKKIMRLGNTAPIEKGSMSDEEYAAKVQKGKEALEKFVSKQMVWHKEAPEEHHTKDGDTNIVVVDVWSIDGRHVNSALKKDGHLVHKEEYHHELAQDILSAAAEKSKQDSYKELEEALKESQRIKKEQAKQAREQAEKEEEEAPEPLGFAGYIGLATVFIIVIGAFTNFGRGSGPKKVNLNKKRGPLEKFWMKLKGA